MEQLKHPMLTEKNTRVYHENEADFKFGAPHHYSVVTTGSVEGVLATIAFQEGPIQENGVNGVANEDLLGMVLDRLEHFQKGPYSCRENALAITKIEEALMWLRKRTIAREQRGVVGTSTI